MKFSIMSLFYLIALVCAMPITSDPSVEVVENLERRGKKYSCATPKIWYNNGKKSSAWASDCAALAKKVGGKKIGLSGWRKVATHGSCVYGVRRLNTGSIVKLTSADNRWLINESLKKFRTKNGGLGAQGEWRCDKIGGMKANVQFWIGHKNNW